MSVEMELLLKPISADRPCGDDLAYSPLFDDIAEVRREDDASLDQGEWVAALKVADWPQVVDKAAAALASQTKDLRLAGWLAEALGKTESFAGIASGLEVIEQLCERYWDELHPLIDDGDAEARVGHFGWTITRLAALARELPLTSDARLLVSFNDHVAAQTLHAAMARDPEAAEQLAFGRITLADIAVAVEQSGAEFYRRLRAGQAAAKDVAERLARQIDDRLGAEGPNFMPLIAALEEIRVLTRQLAESAGLPGEDRPAAAIGEVATGDGPGENSAAAPAALRSRAQALVQLRQVAEFFRRTEPHSPVAYLADRAARWGDMPLHAWLRTVIKDDAALDHLEELLGVDSPPRERDGA